jgi:hypothetical protein
MRVVGGAYACTAVTLGVLGPSFEVGSCDCKRRHTGVQCMGTDFCFAPLLGAAHCCVASRLRLLAAGGFHADGVQTNSICV